MVTKNITTTLKLFIADILNDVVVQGFKSALSVHCCAAKAYNKQLPHWSPVGTSTDLKFFLRERGK